MSVRLSRTVGYQIGGKSKFWSPVSHVSVKLDRFGLRLLRTKTRKCREFIR